MKLTTKQEKFTLDLFSGMYQRDAYIDAYHPTYSMTTIDGNASRLANNEKVLARLAELKAKAESARVMDVRERMERLSEIARARLTDYQESGLDSGYISIGKDSPNTAALAGIESATKFDENGNTGTLFTKVKLHDPIKAIDVLNKMDKLYAENVVNVDNRQVNIKEVIINVPSGITIPKEKLISGHKDT